MKLFARPGKENTAETLKIAVEGAKARGISKIVIASNSGQSVQELLKLDVAGMKIVCVSHVCGFKNPGEQEMSDEVRAELEKSGVKVVTMTHALSGGERAISNKFHGLGPMEVAAYTLRMFGQGTKVCVEIALMAADAGAIGYREPVMAIGGTGTGEDTAIVLRAGHTASWLDTKVDEILCKPQP